MAGRHRSPSAIQLAAWFNEDLHPIDTKTEGPLEKMASALSGAGARVDFGARQKI